MIKRILSLLLVAALLLLTGCAAADNTENGGENGGQSGGQSGGENGGFVMKGSIIEIDDDYIAVDVTESPYATGKYHLITDTCEFFDGDARCERDDLKVGDVIEITYSGQVMMSSPPQVSARKIKIV